MPKYKYAVTYKDSNGKLHYDFVEAHSADEAKAEVKKKSQKLEGMGGSYNPVYKVVKAERTVMIHK